MPSRMNEICRYMQKCAEKFEEELKTNINDCINMVTSRQATDVRLGLEKAKDFHYKEILKCLGEIITNIRKIIYHEESVRKLSRHEEMTKDEFNKYSYVQRQVSLFSGKEPVTRREKRRHASEVSVYSLEAWEQYLKKKEDEEKRVSNPTPENVIVSTRVRAKGHRKQKKIISSTYNNFLESEEKPNALDQIHEEDRSDSNSNLSLSESSEDCIKEESEEEFETPMEEADHQINESHETDMAEALSLEVSSSKEECERAEVSSSKEEYERVEESSKYSVTNLIKTLSQECLLGDTDTKPKIVDVVYKKKDT